MDITKYDTAQESLDKTAYAKEQIDEIYKSILDARSKGDTSVTAKMGYLTYIFYEALGYRIESHPLVDHASNEHPTMIISWVPDYRKKQLLKDRTVTEGQVKNFLSWIRHLI